MSNAQALDKAMQDRREVIGKRWQTVAKDAGISTQHLSRIRNGQVPLNSFTAAAIDRAMEWPHGYAWSIYTGDRTKQGQSAEQAPDARRERIEAFVRAEGHEPTPELIASIEDELARLDVMSRAVRRSQTATQRDQVESPKR